MINESALRNYLLKKFPDSGKIDIRKLGSGVQGSGFLVEIHEKGVVHAYVVKTLRSDGLGHDYPSDRAGVFLLDLDEFGNLPGHVRALDVLAEMENGAIKSIGGGREYYLLMEKAEGKDYFSDLSGFVAQDRLTELDLKKIEAMTSYLAGIHSLKKESRALYYRKLRDTVGHGECLMGVFDTYPEGTLPHEQMTAIIKKSVDWVYRLKPLYKRLSQIHGDFHPGNIWFQSDQDFILLDRSRGPWGDPADDVTALTINYIFFSVIKHGDVRGAYLEALKCFFENYIKKSGDMEITKTVAPFFAFRSVVVANPLFYPEVSGIQRELIFRFCENVLESALFDPGSVNNYL